MELLGNGVEVPGDHSAPVVEIQPVGERPVLRQQELSAALLSEFPDVGHNGEVDRVGAYSQEVPVYERPSQLVFRVGEDLPEKPVIVPDDGGLHLHGGLDVQILLYQGTLGEHIVVDGGFQNSYGLRMLQIVQVEDHVLAVTDFRIHADVVLFNDVPSVQFVPEDTVIQICRGEKHLIRVLAQGEDVLFLYGALTGDFISHHPVEIADNEVGRAVFRAADQQLGRFGSQPVICVTELDVIPRGAVKAGIPCSGNSAVFLVDAQDAGILRRETVQDLRGTVPASVVNKNDFQFRVVLGENAFHASPDGFFRIVDRYDDTYFFQNFINLELQSYDMVIYFNS